MSDTASEDSSAAAGGGVKYYWRRLSQQAYVMAHALGLKKLQEYMQGPNSLAVAPACLLGKFYGEEPEQEGDLVDASIAEDDIEALLQDFKSRLWFTYRKDVPPIGDTHMTSDTGWGCTIRTGQMLIGEALLRCRLGRGFRSSELQQQPGQVLELLQLFQDSPSPLHPLSIHHICQLGAPHGVVAGQWLGPWVLCKALEALVNAGQVQLGLRVHVVCEPGGGAPCLVLSRVKALFTGQLPLEGQGSGQAASEEEGGFVAVQHEEAAAAAGDAAGQAAAGQGGLPPLLLLVPLTLGVDVANPRYLPQLKAALTYPQSVGIVGGRPGSSLYFVGFQGDSLIHLDPHYPQQLAHLPQDLATFFCPTPRLTPLESIDPSLALGFICTTLGELDDLCTRLEALEQQAGGAPLLTMASGSGPPARACTPPLLSQGSLTLVDDAPGGSSAGGEWELL